MICDSANIPGINFIGCIPCEELPPHLGQRADTIIGGYTKILIPHPEEIFFVGVPKLTVKTDYINCVPFSTATLTFLSASFRHFDSSTAFIIRTIDGKNWLLGAREPEYPKVKFEATTGNPGDESATVSYEITHKAYITPVSVVF